MDLWSRDAPLGEFRMFMLLLCKLEILTASSSLTIMRKQPCFQASQERRNWTDWDKIVHLPYVLLVPSELEFIPQLQVQATKRQYAYVHAFFVPLVIAHVQPDLACTATPSPQHNTSLCSHKCGPYPAVHDIMQQVFLLG